MKELSSINYRFLGHSSFRTMTGLCLDVIAESAPAEESDLSKALIKLTAYHDDYATLSEPNVSDSSAVKKEKDKMRDEWYEYLLNSIQSFLKYPDETKQNAALKLLEVIDNIDRYMQNRGYGVETDLLRQLFSLYNQTEFQSLLTELNLLEAYNSLVTAQNDFEAYVKQEALETEKQDPRVTESRKMLEMNFRELLRLIQAAANVADNQHCLDLIDKLNTIIDDAMIPARARNTRSKNSRLEEENPSAQE